MGKLKEYIEKYEQFGFSELEIVEKYITDMGLESEFSEMAIRLTALQLNKQRNLFSKVSEIALNIGEPHHNKYTKDENRFIDRLLYNYAFNGRDYFKQYVLENKDKIENMICPQSCWVNMVAEINKVCGIRFKNQEEDVEYVG